MYTRVTIKVDLDFSQFVEMDMSSTLVAHGVLLYPRHEVDGFHWHNSNDIRRVNHDIKPVKLPWQPAMSVLGLSVMYIKSLTTREGTQACRRRLHWPPVSATPLPNGLNHSDIMQFSL